MAGIWKASLLRSMHSCDCLGSSTVPTYVASFKAFSTFTGSGTTSDPLLPISIRGPRDLRRSGSSGQACVCVCLCVRARSVLGEDDCYFFSS